MFACDRVRPFARVDNMGLLWFVNGGTILALHRDGAVIDADGRSPELPARDD